MPNAASIDAVLAALASVNDPEIGRPITDLGMVKSVDVDPSGVALVAIYLTVASCPMRDTLTDRVREAVLVVPGVTDVSVELDVMSDEQRSVLKRQLRGQDDRVIPFAQPGSLTRVYAIASGKGGVGKSSVTANLAVAMAQLGLSVGILDADVYGHSIPRIIGANEPPTMVEGMIMPPQANGVRVISILPFKPGGSPEPVAYRGPMLHRVLEQFLADVWWGDLDVLLLDLPPGTGDVAMSTAQLVPSSEVVVVTTPQGAAADVAIRAGMLAGRLNQRIAGVVENMSGFPCPHCGEPIDLFGVGGGQLVADQLSSALSTDVPLLARIPFDVALRDGGDRGIPFVVSAPDAPAAAALRDIAERLGHRPRGLAGQSLGLTPAGR